VYKSINKSAQADFRTILLEKEAAIGKPFAASKVSGRIFP
jgi:hypothetical protein